jgi:hypothetical protein
MADQACSFQGLMLCCQDCTLKLGLRYSVSVFAALACARAVRCAVGCFHFLYMNVLLTVGVLETVKRQGLLWDLADCAACCQRKSALIGCCCG